MKNLNSDGEFFEGKVFQHNTHYRMLPINYNRKKRRRTSYKGIVNQEPAKKPTNPELF